MSSSKENLITLLNEITQQTKFQVTQPRRLLTLSEFHAEYDRSKMLYPTLQPNPQSPADCLAALVQELYPLLKPYMDSKEKDVAARRIYILYGAVETTLEDFVQKLVGVSAILGADRVMQLLFGWIEGEPVDYQEKMILPGVTIDASLALEEGIRLERLPSSQANWYAYIPQSILIFSRALKSMHGVGVVLSVDCRKRPVFSKRVKNEAWREAEYTWGHGRMPGRSVDSIFCEALSLACNHCILKSVQWLDYGELNSFSLIASGNSFTEDDFSSGFPPKVLTQGDLELAWDICLARQDAEKSGLNLDIAIHRWIKSKRPDAHGSDQFIDLRIALENLLLKDNGGEKGFRLAAHGAWYLGCDSNERHQHFSTLHGAYQLASKVIHAGDFEYSTKNHTLLVNAQKLCRDIIVKRLREKHAPDWNKIIFGAQAV